MLSALVAGLACHRAARRGGPERRAWTLLSVAMLLWAVAAAGWLWVGVSRDHAYPFPSVLDVGFIGYAIPAAAGLLAFPREPQLAVSWFRALMDAVVVASSVLFVSWATVLGPVAESDDTGLTRATALGYPIADVVMVSLVLVLGLRRPAQARLPWFLLGGGLFVLSVTDSIFVSLVSLGEPTIGTLYQAGWTACFLLVALATITPRRRVDQRVQHFTLSRELLPYAPVIAAIVVGTTRELPVLERRAGAVGGDRAPGDDRAREDCPGGWPGDNRRDPDRGAGASPQRGPGRVHGQVGLPGNDEPRDPHPDERGDRPDWPIAEH
jgi:hypothetical protein